MINVLKLWTILNLFLELISSFHCVVERWREEWFGKRTTGCFRDTPSWSSQRQPVKTPFESSHPKFLALWYTLGILCGTGDLIAQQGLESKGLAAHDFRRTGRMVFFGTFFVGPAISNWYKILHRVVTLKNPVQG